MARETTHGRLIRSINSKYIYGRVPVLHAVILLIQLCLVARLTTKFNDYYEERPVMTMMVTNAILAGMADTVAQLFAAFNSLGPPPKDYRPARTPPSIELQELGREDGVLGFEPDVRYGEALPFDFERLVRFMAYGMGMAPVQYKWYRLLEYLFPITESSALVPALKRVLTDQVVFSPFSIFVFFVVMTIAEGGDVRSIWYKLTDMYFPTLKASYVIWPAVQCINFRLMPTKLQLPFVSCVSIAWTAYLSLANAS